MQSSTEAKTQQQNTIISDEYEYDINGTFNLWDLDAKTKAMLFKRYNELPPASKIKNSAKYMKINYG